MQKTVSLIITCVILLSTAVFGQGGFQNPLLEIGSRRELFVDDYLIEKMSGHTELRLHKPVMREVVLVHDEPWEGSTCAYHTILQDGELYRMYYRGSNAPNLEETHRPVTCYAVSVDGIHWKKPALGIIEFEGTTANNIVWDGKGARNFQPFIDTNPDCDPDEKYKAVGGNRKHDKGPFTFCSPDGIHWEMMSETPIVTDYYSLDGDNAVFWDTYRNEYRCYIRHRQNRLRAFMTFTSKDFINWTEPVFLEYPGTEPIHIYTHMVMPYQYAHHLFIGFPARFIKKRGEIVEPLFMSSRDGVVFKRWEESIIRPGLNRERWLNRSNYVWNGMVTTASDLPGAPDELSLYSNECYYTTEPTRTRRFTYRKDGFVSINASFESGEVVTKPFIFTGSDLYINFSTSAAGFVIIELQDADGNPIPGYTEEDSPEHYGDETDKRIEWKDDSGLERFQGKPVRLRFILKDADLYSLQFR